MKHRLRTTTEAVEARFDCGWMEVTNPSLELLFSNEDYRYLASSLAKDHNF